MGEETMARLKLLVQEGEHALQRAGSIQEGGVKWREKGNFPWHWV
jgi:hypothetical protein